MQRPASGRRRTRPSTSGDDGGAGQGEEHVAAAAAGVGAASCAAPPGRRRRRDDRLRDGRGGPARRRWRRAPMRAGRGALEHRRGACERSRSSSRRGSRCASTGASGRRTTPRPTARMNNTTSVTLRALPFCSVTVPTRATGWWMLGRVRWNRRRDRTGSGARRTSVVTVLLRNVGSRARPRCVDAVATDVWRRLLGESEPELVDASTTSPSDAVEPVRARSGGLARGRCRSGRRSSPTGRARRSPSTGRPTCTCRRW